MRTRIGGTSAATQNSVSRTLLAVLVAATFVASGFVLTPSVAQAQALSIVEDFNSNALPATLEESGLSPNYSGGVVTFPDYDRRYLRTIANYNNSSFIAEVTVTVSTGFGGEGMAFIGFGAGEPNCGFFCEPMVAPNIYARIGPDDFGPFVGVTNGIVEHIGDTVDAGDGTHRVRITWNHVTQEFTFAIHRYYAGGPFVPTTVIGPVVVTDVFGDSNSRIFFGGAGNATFDDLQVLSLAGTPGVKNCHGKTVSALAQDLGGIGHAASAFGFPSVDALQDFVRGFCGN